MIHLAYLISAIVAFLGLCFGIILVFIAPEEQKPGKRYLIILENIFLIIILIFLLGYFYHHRLSSIFYIILWLFFLALLTCSVIDLTNNIIPSGMIRKPRAEKHPLLMAFKRRIKNSCSIYAALAIIFCLSYQNKNLFFIESALIFLYGLPMGSLLADPRNKKQNITSVLKHIHFLVIALLLAYL